MAPPETTIIEALGSTALRQLSEVFKGTGGSSSQDLGDPTAQARREEQQAIDDTINSRRSETRAIQKTDTFLTKLGKSAKATAGFLNNMLGGALMKGTLEEFQSGVAGGTEAVENFGEYLNRTTQAYAQLGVSVKELNEFNKVSRAASINLGGYDAWTQKLTERQAELFARIGDNTKAVQYQSNMMNILTHSGLQANDFYDEFGKRLTKTSDNLLKMGVSYEESSEALKEIMEDEDVRFRLRGAASKAERRQIVLDTQATFEHFKQLGMTNEAAKRATKALDKLGGKGPIERFRDAAKMQMAMSAMGIENAAEVAAIQRKSAVERTQEEREILAKALGRVEDITAEAAKGGFAKEAYIRTLAQKSGVIELAKGFSTKMDEGAKITDEQLEAIKLMGRDTPNITKTFHVVSRLSKFLESHLVQGTSQIITALSTLGTALLGPGGFGGTISKIGTSIDAMDGISGKLAKTGAIATAAWAGYEAGTMIYNGVLANSETFQKLSDGFFGWFGKGISEETKKQTKAIEDQGRKKRAEAMGLTVPQYKQFIAAIQSAGKAGKTKEEIESIRKYYRELGEEQTAQTAEKQLTTSKELTTAIKGSNAKMLANQERQTQALEKIAKGIDEGNKKTDKVVEGVTDRKGPPGGFQDQPAEAQVKSPSW